MRLKNLFSIETREEGNKRHKVIRLLFLKLKFRISAKNKPVYIVKLMGGLGNQMFQYAFGKALAKHSGVPVFYDLDWFTTAKEAIINNKKENAEGVVIREFALDVFNLNLRIATRKQIENCKNIITESKYYEFDKDLMNPKVSAVYQGYFQNEGYLKKIEKDIRKDFTFPKIPCDDKINSSLLKRIRECKNPVFVHIRRGDYVNLGWNLSSEYYRKAFDYIELKVKNPTFFIFGVDCEDYINSEFKGLNYEIVGNTNSLNKEDWKDLVLMEECRHAIIANSTFSWWAAWLGKSNKGIVIAPSPFISDKDGIICKHWIKIRT